MVIFTSQLNANEMLSFSTINICFSHFFGCVHVYLNCEKLRNALNLTKRIPKNSYKIFGQMKGCEM